MSKAFLVLDDEEQLILERICADRDEDEALAFIIKNVVPKLRKKVPCLAGELMRHEG